MMGVPVPSAVPRHTPHLRPGHGGIQHQPAHLALQGGVDGHEARFALHLAADHAEDQVDVVWIEGRRLANVDRAGELDDLVGVLEQRPGEVRLICSSGSAAVLIPSRNNW